jgi:hypothetical protein
MAFKAIPTKYKGIQFMSRLEAKWAAFFDLMNWKWQYEPCDFNGWIPDFAIYGHKKTIYVEVKPTIVFLPDIANEIDSSGCNAEVLLIGETCPIPGCHTMCGDNTQLGWLRTEYLGYPDGQASRFNWSECEFACYDGSRIGFAESTGCWYCRIYGTHGKYYHFNNVIEDTVSEHWASACNSSQWRRPQ